MVLGLISVFAPFIANDRPILVSYKGELLYPTFMDYPESKFGGFLARTDFRDPVNQEEIAANGWMIWPLIRYSYNTVNNELPMPAPSPPALRLTREEACARYPAGTEDPNCNFGNLNWLGTDDQGRDVVARLIYGFRISVAFGLILTFVSSIIGMAAGAVQGYFGGWTDLLFQRFIEIWTSMPVSTCSSSSRPSSRPPSGSCCSSWSCSPGHRSWGSCGPNSSARGTSNMCAPPARWGFRMPGSCSSISCPMRWSPPSPSCPSSCRLRDGADVARFPWLRPAAGLALAGRADRAGEKQSPGAVAGPHGFFVVSLMLSLLVFIGEAVRDALDPRKTFA
jgi:microcin C transport system permease protein